MNYEAISEHDPEKWEPAFRKDLGLGAQKCELNDCANQQQDGDFHSSIFVERNRSGIGGWELSGRDRRRIGRAVILSGLSARFDYDFRAGTGLPIDPLDLQVAQDRDKAMRESDASSQGAQ